MEKLGMLEVRVVIQVIHRSVGMDKVVSTGSELSLLVGWGRVFKVNLGGTVKSFLDKSRSEGKHTHMLVVCIIAVKLHGSPGLCAYRKWWCYCVPRA